MIKRITVILFSLLTLSVSSQRFPIFSQYIFNGLLLNPAYAGSRDVLSVSMLYRNNWVGFNGAPVYQSLSAHAPTRNNKTGVGILLLNESYGSYSNTHMYFNYSYLIRTDNGAVSLGIKAGINYANFNYKNIRTNEPDEAFDKSVASYLLPNFGTGAYYYNDKYFLGFSIPYLLSYKENSSRNGYELLQDINQYDFLVTSGFLWKVANDVKLKPSTLVKYNISSGTQIDLNLNVILLEDKLWAGAGYRMFNAMACMLEYQVNPQFRVGYSYDYSLGDNSTLRYSSHEFTLRYEFSYRIKAANPRYF